jgi:N-acetylglutamate synthase-like GNAT family acetyltransferase
MPPLHIRRATLDDLPALRSLWTNAGWPADELESRLTEFQVVEANGAFAGALGVQIVRQHLRFHSEDYVDFSVADAARELFWERIQKLAANHGVFRVWTQETSPFWKHWGFQPANAELLERLPAEWQSGEGRWLTLELKNEDAINAALEQQLPGWLDAGRKQTERIASHGRKIRIFFTVIFFAIGLVGIALAIYLALRHPLTAR